MAKRIYSATPGAGLTVSTVRDKDMHFEGDVDGYSETKAIPFDTMFHSKITSSQSDTGSATATADFTSYEAIQSTIDEDCLITVTGMQDESVYWLKVIKGASDMVTFYGVGGEYIIPSHQYGKTVLYFRITHYDTTSDDTIIIEPVMTTEQSSLITSKFSGTGFTVSSLTYFDYTLEGTKCNFEMLLTIEMTAAQSAVTVNIADWAILKLNAALSTPCACEVIKNGATNITKSAIVNETSMIVTFDSAVAISDSITIMANGPFQIQ